MKFRKLPVVVDAVQFTGDNWDELSEHFGDFEVDSVWVDGDNLVLVTLEGEMTAKVGDWIVRGVKGEFYPCKPDIFEQTYERVFSDEEIEAGYRELARQMLEEETYVCTKHLKFEPCRPCMRDDTDFYSCDPVDVERVRKYQRGEQ